MEANMTYLLDAIELGWLAYAVYVGVEYAVWLRKIEAEHNGE
jgi:hypothetical protein